MIGSRSTIASAKSMSEVSGASAKVARRLPSAVSGPKVLRTSRICQATVFHCSASEPSRLLDLGLLLREFAVLALELHLLELAQGAQARVEDRVGLQLGELEDAHQLALRLVLLADDLDDPVEVEIDDEEAAQDLEAPLDDAEAVARAADQHVAAMVEPFAQGLGEAEHPRHLAAREHVHVERDAALELGQPEQAIPSGCVGSTVRERGSSTTRTSSADSSRMSARSGSFRSCSSSATFSMRRDFGTP